MTVFLDTTALLGRYLEGQARELIVEAMAEDGDWCASAVALTEALTLIDRLGPSGGLGGLDTTGTDDLRRALRDDWERMWIVPVDGPCLDRAAELGRTQPLRTVDALHLAAADRLPRPLRYLTFDPAQIPVALALGFDVVSTFVDGPT